MFKQSRSSWFGSGFGVGFFALAAGVLCSFAIAQPRTARDNAPGAMNQMPAEIDGLKADAQTLATKLGKQIPLDLVFTDADGNRAPLAKFFNKDHRPTLLVLVYFRCPMQCPFTMDRYTDMLRQIDSLTIGKDFNVLFVSFDPTENASNALVQRTRYLAKYDRGPSEVVIPGFQFLTSQDPGAARRLAEAVGFEYRYLEASGEYAHPSIAYVVAPDGRVSRVLDGLGIPLRDLRFGLIDAADGKIGSTVDAIFKFCFHYDPDAGAYTVWAFRVMQVAAIGMALFVGSVITAMLFVEQRRKRRLAAMGIVDGQRPAYVPTQE